jgi:two-component system OmpR family response regulator
MKKILIVDDDVRLLDITRKVLEATGQYEVMTEDSGRRALTAAATFKPDLMILDVMMPRMDGGEVARALRKHPVTRDVPVLFLTSLANRGMKDGANDGKHGIGRYLAKPVDPQELCCCVAECLLSQPTRTSSCQCPVPGVARQNRIRKTAPDVQVSSRTGEPIVETAAEAARAGASGHLARPSKSAPIGGLWRRLFK